MKWHLALLIEGQDDPDISLKEFFHVDSKNIKEPVYPFSWPIFSGQVIITHNPPYLTDGVHDPKAEAIAFQEEVTSEELIKLASGILQVLATPDPQPSHYWLARMVLKEEGSRQEKPDIFAISALAGAKAGNASVLDLLARALADTATQIKNFMLPAMTHENTKKTFQGDMFLPDSLFADWVAEQFGNYGDEYARLIREEARERWANYTHKGLSLFQNMQPHGHIALFSLWVDRDMQPLPARWPRGLCRALWLSRIRPILEQAHRKPPAVAGPLFETLFRLHRSGIHLVSTDEKGLVVQDTQGIEVASFQQIKPLRIATVQIGVAQQLAQTGVGLLGSLNAHRLLDWMIPEAHHRATANQPDARTLIVDGGWSTLASLIGSTSKKAADDLHAIVAAMAYLAIPLPDGSVGNLLAYRDVPARGRRSGSIELVLGTALMPNYVYELHGEDRILIPWPPAVPLVGRLNEHGAQRALRLRFLIELRKRARELALKGSVQITEEEWANLAREAELPFSVLRPVLDRWTQDGDDGPAFLKLFDGNRYTIGDAHLDVRTFLEDAGRLAEAGSRAGQKSVQLKRDRLLHKNRHLK